MKITDIMPLVEDSYYDPKFLKVIEDHLTYLRTTGKVATVTLTNTQCQKFQGNFFGLLIELQVDSKYYQMVLRVNNLLHPGDFTGETNVIILPDFTVFNQLKSVFDTQAA